MQNTACVYVAAVQPVPVGAGAAGPWVPAHLALLYPAHVHAKTQRVEKGKKGYGRQRI